MGGRDGRHQGRDGNLGQVWLLQRDIIDVKWVLKWTHEQQARSVQESQATGPAQTKRVIRA
eukprot:9744656-Alexandrium_andersonii.AAC.1